MGTPLAALKIPSTKGLSRLRISRGRAGDPQGTPGNAGVRAALEASFRNKQTGVPCAYALLCIYFGCPYCNVTSSWEFTSVFKIVSRSKYKEQLLLLRNL